MNCLFASICRRTLFTTSNAKILKAFLAKVFKSKSQINNFWVKGSSQHCLETQNFVPSGSNNPWELSNTVWYIVIKQLCALYIVLGKWHFYYENKRNCVDEHLRCTCPSEFIHPNRLNCSIWLPLIYEWLTNFRLDWSWNHFLLSNYQYLDKSLKLVFFIDINVQDILLED